MYQRKFQRLQKNVKTRLGYVVINFVWIRLLKLLQLLRFGLIIESMCVCV